MLAAAVFLLLPVAILCDYYDDLQLPKREESSESDIKKQFRILSRKLHPDLNPAPDAREAYQKVQKAHGVLSDRKQRKIYDMMGEEGLKNLEAAQQKGHQQHGMGIFGNLFGGQQDNTKGADVQMNLKVSLADIYNGAEHTLTLKKQKLRGKHVVETCLKCKAQPPVMQKVQVAPGFVMQQQVPPNCDHQCGGGSKQVIKDHSQQLEVMIEQGIPEGHKIVYDMEADEWPDRLPGDVIFKVVSAPHPMFSRKRDDLRMTMEISLLESLVGFSKEITHLDGHIVEVKRSDVTQHGHKMSIKGEGMPRHNVPSEKGNLIITFEVKFPTTVSAHQASRFQALLE
eukprot:TRINITY_DN9709_c0_g1_i1.p1 TRINITY_DN9709_c0_g1~~TRINITY_DN9709_c0_g1_i1.p1  ORF type:complete len:341 (+),score=96.69 TRINITY_DN9709_c0_g1_i1:50-1072(+)